MKICRACGKEFEDHTQIAWEHRPEIVGLCEECLKKFDGPAPYSDHTSSRQAAEDLAKDGELKTKRMQVYHALATSGPLACFEVMSVLHMPHQTVSARINELVERHMAERLQDVVLNPTTNKMQEKVRALPPERWQEVPHKVKKKELIDLLCEALLAYVRRPELWGTTEYNHALKILSLAGWKIEEQGGQSWSDGHE